MIKSILYLLNRFYPSVFVFKLIHLHDYNGRWVMDSDPRIKRVRRYLEWSMYLYTDLWLVFIKCFRPFWLFIIIHYDRDWYNPKKKDRLWMQIALGYGIPLIISIFTLIVEFTSPRCAIYRPRFGEETCFFSGRITFASWNIYLQISIIMYIQILSSLNVVSI